MADQQNRMSCPPRRFVEEFCQLREKKKWTKWNENSKQTRICMMLRFFEVDTTRKQLKIHFVGFSRHEYDEWRDYDK